MIKVGDWVVGDFNFNGRYVYPNGYIVMEIMGNNIRPVPGTASAPNGVKSVLISRPSI